jgi:cytochrome b
MSGERGTRSGSDRRLIWDWPVRITHWAMVASVIGSYVTHRLGAAQFRYHRWFGYTTLVLVAVRILWGVVGTRHARFTSFVHGPATVVRYLADLVGRRAPACAGHNPAGGWMVLVLLSLLAAQALTGLFANDDVMNTGPLYGYVLASTSDRLAGWHRGLFDVLLIAIALHVAAIAAHRVVGKANLIRPMLTGYKSAAETSPSDAISSSRLWLWLVLTAAVSAALAWIIARAPEASLFVF